MIEIDTAARDAIAPYIVNTMFMYFGGYAVERFYSKISMDSLFLFSAKGLTLLLTATAAYHIGEDILEMSGMGNINDYVEMMFTGYLPAVAGVQTNNFLKYINKE